MSGKYAFATLVTGPDYVTGAIALARSLLACDSAAPLVVMATASAGDLSGLERFGCKIVSVDQLPVSEGFRERHSREAVHRASPFTKGEKPAFHDPLDNFCKLRLWQLTQFERVVFLDADTLVVKNIDRLFGYPEFSAAPNLYETLDDMHRLNSGVFVAQPSGWRFDDMLECLDAPNVYWRRTDQTFLETYFPHWHGLPYIFNTLQYVYFNLPQLWRPESVHLIHYQYEKPWQPDHPKLDRLGPLVELWQRVFDTGELPDQIPAP